MLRWYGRSAPFLIAEIGGNHEGSFDSAIALCKQAIDSGADCIKFQIYSGDKLVSSVESPSRNQHFKNFELSKKQHLYLAQMCIEAGVYYNASVWDLEAFEWIDPFLNFYKIGSGDLTAWPIIRSLAMRGKPILLSTGLATLTEVKQTVEFIRSINDLYCDANNLCVLQCTSMYPIPSHEANLRVMDVFRETFDTSVGYSDHTVGVSALEVAACMGAEVLEFHFTDMAHGRTFRDHEVSLTAEQVGALKIKLREISALRGSHIKEPQASELSEGHVVSFRRGVYPNRDLTAGEIISERDLILLRPSLGTDPREFDEVVGSVALRDIKRHSALFSGLDFSKEES